MLPTKNKTAIVGVGYTDMVRYSERSLADTTVEAALNAIKDAGLTLGDIDGYSGPGASNNAGAMNIEGVDQVSATYMVNALGLAEPRWVSDGEGGVGGGLVAAARALDSGACNYIVLQRAMYHPPRVRYAGFRNPTIGGPPQFTVPYGIGDGIGGGGNRHAMWLQRYMYDYGATREELYAVIKADRRHANMNPFAYWRDKGVTLEDYMSTRWIYEPISMLDCDIPVTGAGAVVVTTAERARDLPHKPAYIAGYSQDPGEPSSSIYEVSDIDRTDVQVAQIYDGYSPFVYYWLEVTQFCATGEAHSYIQDGRIELGGELPVNTFGGSLGEGRLHGFGHLREAAIQVMGRGGERQVPNVENCLLTIGPPRGRAGERSGSAGGGAWILMLSTG